MNTLSKWDETSSSVSEKDVAATFLAQHGGVSTNAAETPETVSTERRLLWKIDGILMPVMTISYGLQYYDKAILGSAAVFGILDDLHLSQVVSTNPTVVSLNRYSQATAIFYVGYIIGALPMAFLLQRLPIRSFLSAMIFLWGLICLLTITCNSFEGFMAQRFFLGFVESSVSPGFILISSMWYKKQEQPIRLGIWYSATGLFSIFSGVLNYGIGQIHGSLPTWKYMYIFAGSLTMLWGIIVFLVLPDNPTKPHWAFNVEERRIAVERVRGNLTGVENKRFKLGQVLEALCDFKTYLYFIMAASIYIANGGVTAFGAYIVKSFGYSSLRTILLLTPAGATTAVSIYISSVLASKFPDLRTHLIAFTCLPVIAGSVMIWKSDWTNRAVPLAGYYLLGIFGAPYVLLLSSVTANTAGHTKKAFLSGAVFVAYCVGNIIAPYLVDTTQQANHYRMTWESLIICYVLVIILAYILYGGLKWENRRRDGKAEKARGDEEFARYGEEGEKAAETKDGLGGNGGRGSIEEASRVDAARTAFNDMTDFENPHFRYAL